MLVRLAYDFFNDMEKGHVFRKYVIGKAIRMPDWAADITRGVVGADAIVSDSLSPRCGIVKLGDVFGSGIHCVWQG